MDGMKRTLFGLTRQGSGRLRLIFPIFLRYGTSYDVLTDHSKRGWWITVVCIGGYGRFRIGEVLL